MKAQGYRQLQNRKTDQNSFLYQPEGRGILAFVDDLKKRIHVAMNKIPYYTLQDYLTILYHAFSILAYRCHFSEYLLYVIYCGCLGKS